MRDIRLLNASTWYVYPLYKLDSQYLEYLYQTYVYHEDEKLGGKSGDIFYILFKFNGRASNLFQEGYLELEERLIEHPDYYFHYDIEGGQYVMFGMYIPMEYQEDYNHFIKGEYSKIRRTGENSAYSLINNLWRNESIKAIMDKSDKFRRDYSQLLSQKYDTNIEIPEGQEVYKSLSDKSMEEAELFKLEKLPIKVL